MSNSPTEDQPRLISTLILSDAARRAGMWLAYEEDFIFLKSGENTLCEFTHHAPPNRIREAADLFLTGVRA